MKSLLVIIMALLTTGCATYQTHRETGCVWSCRAWTENPELRPDRSTIAITGLISGSSAGTQTFTVNQVILPSGGYTVIRSPGLTTVTRTSTTRR